MSRPLRRAAGPMAAALILTVLNCASPHGAGQPIVPVYDLVVRSLPVERRLEVRGTIELPAADSDGDTIDLDLSQVMGDFMVKVLEPSSAAGPAEVLKKADIPNSIGGPGTTTWSIRPKRGPARFREIVAGAYEALDVDGVLGYNFFRDLLFTIDYPNMTLVLDRGSLHGEDAGVLTFELVERMPYLRIRAEARNFLVNFDTGAADWIVFPESLAAELPWAVEPVPGPMVWNNQTGETRVSIGRLAAELTFGPYTIETPRIHLDPAVEAPFFGSALLKEFALTFDATNRRVRVRRQAAGVTLRVPPYRTLGLSLRRGSEKAERGRRPVEDVTIDDVIPGTPAATAGLRIGMVVSSIDDRPASEVPSEEWSTLQQSRDVIELAVLDAGTARRVVLEVVELGREVKPQLGGGTPVREPLMLNASWSEPCETSAPDMAVKLGGRPVTSLAMRAAGLGTGPGCADAAPGHPAA